MKKLFYLGLISLILLIPQICKAKIITKTPCNPIVLDKNGRQVKTCFIDLIITDETRFYEVSGQFILTNTSLAGNIEAGDSRITITNQDLNNLTFTSKTPIKNETIRIAKFTIVIPQNDLKCSVLWKPQTYGINYVCEIKNGNYYDKNGNLVSQTEYSIQCLPHTCEIIGDTYFGKDGKVVSQTEYSIQCLPHTCEKIGDVFFDQKGNIVSEAKYNEVCFKHICEIINGIYFGKDGNPITDYEYNLQCNSHFCEIIGNTYFGKNGNVVSPNEYNVQCLPQNPNPKTTSSGIFGYLLVGLLTFTGIEIIICFRKSKKTPTI